MPSATKCEYTCKECGKLFLVSVRLNTPEIKTLYCKNCIATWKKAHRKKSTRGINNRNTNEGLRFMGVQSESPIPYIPHPVICGKCGIDMISPQHILCQKCEQEEREDKERCAGAPREIIQWANGAIYSHRARGHTINFSVTELISLALNTGDFCPICGEKFTMYKNGGSRSYDRVFNRRSYNIHDVGIICVRCNSIKGNKTPQELKLYLHSFLNYIDSHIIKQMGV